MNGIRWLVLFVLVDFVGLTGYALYHHGYAGLFELHLANSAGVQVLVDLVIALSIVMIWMWRDAREQGISAVPYLAVTLVLGSIGPLLYLFRRFRPERAEVPGHALAVR